MYYNVEAYAEMLPAMLDFADSKDWEARGRPGPAAPREARFERARTHRTLSPRARAPPHASLPAPQFQTDQDLLLTYMGSPDAARWREPWHRLTSLPDAYNSKVPPHAPRRAPGPAPPLGAEGAVRRAARALGPGEGRQDGFEQLHRRLEARAARGRGGRLGRAEGQGRG
jgi:hypothetical protein